MYANPDDFVMERLRKRAELLDAGYNPYPSTAYAPTHTVTQVIEKADKFSKESKQVRIAGRVVARRSMGKVVFLDLLDDGSRLQAFIRRPSVGEDAWRVIELLDLGDFLGVEGVVFHTRVGELSVNADAISLLGKASHPIPLPKQQGDRLFDAVTDRGTLARHRHIDLVCNPTHREAFIQRSRIISGIRRYLDDAGFIEVETPVLGASYGGAAARPFITRARAVGEQVFMRISPECALKRIMCGGINKVYELGKSFRNEGIDATHNPEFTTVEWYEAYSDYREQMERFETLVATLCETIHGTTQITYQGRELDLSTPWERLPMVEALSRAIGQDVRAISAEEMPAIFKAHHPRGEAALPSPLVWGAAVVELFEELVEPELWGPVFVMDHPLEVSPLTKAHRDDPRLVERFEPMIAGMEVGNAYSELNDPVEQYERLATQRSSREERYALDEEFIQAVAHGMPPAGGVGLGVDRIVMILTDSKSIRDILFFPQVSHHHITRQRDEEG